MLISWREIETQRVMLLAKLRVYNIVNIKVCVITLIVKSEASLSSIITQSLIQNHYNHHINIQTYVNHFLLIIIPLWWTVETISVLCVYQGNANCGRWLVGRMVVCLASDLFMTMTRTSGENKHVMFSFYYYHHLDCANLYSEWSKCYLLVTQ